jgi:uncharacterized membrane protein YgcG
MTLEKKRLVFLLALVVSLLALSGFANAIEGRMGNAKMILYPEVDGKREVVIEKSISVRNVNNETINISVVADEDAEKFIEIIDKTFLLEPNSQKDAQFEIKVKKEGVYQGKINVFFKPLDPEKNGVVLSSEVTVVAKKDQDYQDTGDDDDNTDNNETGGGSSSSSSSSSSGGGGDGKFNPIILFVFMTLVLIVILVFLIRLMNKKFKKRRNTK